jgi:hypothetical protein
MFSFCTQKYIHVCESIFFVFANIFLQTAINICMEYYVERMQFYVEHVQYTALTC